MWFPVIEFPFSQLFKRAVSVPTIEPELEIELMEIPEKRVLNIADDFQINLDDWTESGDRDAILASSGMGKSYLAGVIMEELIESGTPVFIIDPEGENYTLAERYPMLIVGGEYATVNINLDDAKPEAIENIVKAVLSQGISIIFDLSNRTVKDQRLLFTQIVGALFSLQDSQENRRPVKLIVEEARLFAPQKVTGLPDLNGETCLSVFENIATRGRKRGINMMLATQRPASINKDILSQCNRWWFGGMQSTQDCNAMKPYLADAGITEEQIRELTPGNFYYSAHGQATKIKSRTRKCRHGGATPTAQPETVKRPSKAQVQATAKKLEAWQSLERQADDD
jgi:uncharacterized protein